MKKYVLLAASFFLIGSLVFAGGGQSGGAKGPQTKIVMTTWYSDALRANLEALIAEYEKSHPNVRVEQNYSAYYDYQAKINTMMSAGNNPDAMFLEEFRINEWGERGVLADLNPYYKSIGIDPKKFYTDGSLFSTGNNLWGVSKILETTVLFYNKKLFRDAGIAFPPESAAKPWTWDQFVDAAKKLTKDRNSRTPNDSGFNYNDVVQWGTTNAGGPGGSWVYVMPLVYAAGSSIANATGTEIEITKPAGVKALQNIADLALVHKAAPTVAMSSSAAFSSIFSMLMDDQLAMFVGVNSQHSNFLDEGYDVGIAQVPSMSGKGNNMTWGNGITMKPNGSQEVFAFINYVLDFNNDIKASKAHKSSVSFLPQTRSIYEDPAKNKEWMEIYNPVMARVAADILQNGSRLGEQHILKNFAEIMDRTLVPSWDRIWLGQETAQQVLNSLGLQSKLRGIWQ